MDDRLPGNCKAARLFHVLARECSRLASRQISPFCIATHSGICMVFECSSHSPKLLAIPDFLIAVEQQIRLVRLMPQLTGDFDDVVVLSHGALPQLTLVLPHDGQMARLPISAT